jgi:hypothetical protein
MSKVTDPYKCDCCGRLKGEGNGWLLGVIIDLHHQYVGLPARMSNDPDDPMFREYGVASANGYAIVKWHDAVAASEIPFVHHLCSEKCALTKQSEYLRRPA